MTSKTFLRKGANLKYDPLQRVKEARDARKYEKEMVRQARRRAFSPPQISVEQLEEQVGHNQQANHSYEEYEENRPKIEQKRSKDVNELAIPRSLEKQRHQSVSHIIHETEVSPLFCLTRTAAVVACEPHSGHPARAREDAHPHLQRAAQEQVLQASWLDQELGQTATILPCPAARGLRERPLRRNEDAARG